MKIFCLSLFMPVFWVLASETGFAQSPKIKMLWFDATANWERLNTKEDVSNILDKCVNAGITDVIVDVKPISGLVLYPSEIAPGMTEWKGVKRDPNYDFLPARGRQQI